MNKRRFTFSGLFLFAAVTLTLFGSLCFAQDIPPLEPVAKHYKTLAKLSAAPSPDRAAMDKIVFPWAEYSTKSLLAAKRPVYLESADSARLHKLIHYPANSSDQTRAELDYLLKVQETRTPEEIKRSEYIASMSSEVVDLGNTRKGFFIGIPVAITSVAFLIGLALLPFGEETRGQPLPA